MSEANWYYAKGDEELGPISSAELKRLGQAGEVRPNDLVWKEGMSDWTPASSVKGLFPAAAQESPPVTTDTATPSAADAAPPPLDNFTVADPSTASATKTSRKRSGRKLTFEPLKYGRAFGQPALLVGLLFVLLARGCDSIGNRNVTRLNAKVSVAQSDLANLPSLEPAERVVLQKEIEEMQNDAANARHHNQMWGYWREMLFVFGSIVLALGLLATGVTGEGAERWICLIMLAIITFSLYVGGIAWISSLPSALGIR